MGATTLAFGMLWTTTSKAASAETTADGITYQVIKTGDGPKPEIGELIAIRFAAYVAATGNKIDDIFDSPEPYYTRLGSGGLLKGVESTLPLMRLGDRWKLTIPVRILLLNHC
jgi:FKBP-type peptidyl-prolyl cis-trans isomerase